MSIVRIEVSFPIAVDLPDGFEKKLDALLSEVCDLYNGRHPNRIMWPFGCGAKVLWREPEEPSYDDSVYSVEVAERKRYPGERS